MLRPCQLVSLLGTVFLLLGEVRCSLRWTVCHPTLLLLQLGPFWTIVIHWTYNEMFFLWSYSAKRSTTLHVKYINTWLSSDQFPLFHCWYNHQLTTKDIINHPGARPWRCRVCGQLWGGGTYRPLWHQGIKTQKCSALISAHKSYKMFQYEKDMSKVGTPSDYGKQLMIGNKQVSWQKDFRNYSILLS